MGSPIAASASLSAADRSKLVVSNGLSFCGGVGSFGALLEVKKAMHLGQDINDAITVHCSNPFLSVQAIRSGNDCFLSKSSRFLLTF
jgi:hypothetical protein